MAAVDNAKLGVGPLDFFKQYNAHVIDAMLTFSEIIWFKT